MKVITRALPSCTNWRASDSQSWLKPTGRLSAWALRNCTAAPMLTPGAGTACRVAELSWLNWVSLLASIDMSKLTRVDSGICAPLAALTYCPTSISADMRWLRSTCGITS
ncbi:hypothetical protein D3C79_835130 [compost metagenome]